MNFQKSFLKAFISVGVFKYSSVVISFLGTVIASRILSTTEYGIVASVAIVTGLFGILIDSGFVALIIRGPDSLPYQQDIAWVFILIGMALATVMALLAWPVSIFFGNSEMVWVCLIGGLMLFAQSATRPIEAILSKRQKFRLIALSNLTINLIQISLMIGLASFGCSFWSLIVPPLLSQVLLFFWYRKMIGFVFGNLSLQKVKTIISSNYSLVGNMLGFRLLAYSTRNIDNLIVGKFFGPALLGLYNRGFNISSLPVNLITGVINEIQLPMYQKLGEKNDDSVSKEYASLLQLIVALGFPIVAILYLFPYQLSAFIWGENWRSVGDYMKPLSIIIPSNLVLNSVGAMFIVRKAERFLFLNSIVSAFGILAGAIIGAFFSLKYMVAGLIIGNLFFSVPITCYLGLFKSMGFTISQILKSWGVFWSISIALLVAYLLESEFLQVTTIIAYGCFAMYNLQAYYFRNFKKKL